MIRRIWTVMLAISLAAALSVSPTSRSLATGSVEFRDGRVIVFEPGSAESPTDLFEAFKGVMPGDTRTEKVEIENSSKEFDYIKVYLKAVPYGTDGEDPDLTAQENDKLLSQLRLTVRQGDKVIYDQSPDQAGTLADNVYLGTLKRGEKTTLDVELKAPIEMGNEFADKLGRVNWVFTVEGMNNPAPKPQPKPSPKPSRAPKTGDPISATLALGAASAAVLAVLKKKEKR